MTSATQHTALHRFTLALIAYTVAIIVWGAWVRISGSGAGCGEHWPLCHGKAIPFGSSHRTWIEVSHRYSTALFGFAVVVLCALARRITTQHNLHRIGAYCVLVFTILEALIGRLLVVRGYVEQDTSISRLIIMPLHLVNTSLLLASEVFTARMLLADYQRKLPVPRIKGIVTIIFLCLLLTLLTSGAIASLGSHLLPSHGIFEGLQADLSTDSHVAVRLRPLHLVFGLSVFALTILVAWYEPHVLRPLLKLKSFRRFLSTMCALVLLGMLTVLLLSPVALKLAHLTVANIFVVSAAGLLVDFLFLPLETNPSQQTSSIPPNFDR
jgi:cytochrome c oxidase assembly protein subunit 15